jgi:hypothetical protein
VFLYGQTGSGKTFNHDAITRAAASTIFGGGASGGDGGSPASELAAVSLSVVEIYCEAIRCLLTGREVSLRQGRDGGILLEGAGEKVGPGGGLERRLAACGWTASWPPGPACRRPQIRPLPLPVLHV